MQSPEEEHRQERILRAFVHRGLRQPFIDTYAADQLRVVARGDFEEVSCRAAARILGWSERAHFH